jgi:hypothetical protein
VTPKVGAVQRRFSNRSVVYFGISGGKTRISGLTAPLHLSLKKAIAIN